MKKILLFGAGKSASVLIEYLISHAQQENWFLTVIDANLSLAQQKLNGSPNAIAASFDINDPFKRQEYIGAADIVISLMPPYLHILIAKDCLNLGRHLLTASYIDNELRSMQSEIDAKGLLFLCEMGLDPGIDHMSAKKQIDAIQAKGGTIRTFYSHCGGLVAPESDNNPWHYKISWNPANVVNAGKAGAYFKKDGQLHELSYDQLFADKRYVAINGHHEVLCWYPNRDSLSYMELYGLSKVDTFIRTTLRHPDYIYGWKNLIELKLTDQTSIYDTNDRTLGSFFKEHMDKNGFNPWLEEKLRSQFDFTKGLLAELVNLVELEQEAQDKGVDPVEELMLVDDKGSLKQMDIDDLKINAASTLADKMHDASLTLKQLFYLGMDDHITQINKGNCSAAEVLQFAMEKKLPLLAEDKDMVIMQHEIEYSIGKKLCKNTSTMILLGQDEVHTAMAKSVGLPLGIATRLILNGKIKIRGLHIPVLKEIYEPVLDELDFLGVSFSETEEHLT
jgi:saccharopine dehydrogenase-like NADP-dependent oxidoreductase